MNLKGKLLHNRRILVAEDEFVVADELRLELEDAGALVISPVGALEGLLRAISTIPRLDGAILDVNLRGETSFMAADRLVAAGVPFVFMTGYDAMSIPARFKGIAYCEKSLSTSNVVRAIRQAIHG